jgi:hypothetical protein
MSRPYGDEQALIRQMAHSLLFLLQEQGYRSEADQLRIILQAVHHLPPQHPVLKPSDAATVYPLPAERTLGWFPCHTSNADGAPSVGTAYGWSNDPKFKDVPVPTDAQHVSDR